MERMFITAFYQIKNSNFFTNTRTWFTLQKKMSVSKRGTNPQKVGSKPKRPERVYKRTAQVQRDFLRTRSGSRHSEAVFLYKNAANQKARRDVVQVFL